ncbi:hypothetical protein EYR41_001073 [Orbilia oligospora]|uniref:Uncharacterized protein n=1 Tax=Orbilia oligospora TaxID=2813651 RepID=A0A8H2E7S1_ORBOL|nr:hypothetical protein TWF132_002888 [Orbilia oligospora]TGJ74020.1 hypothetical protein EYR41_001073 [Orbilia oligospora]
MARRIFTSLAFQLLVVLISLLCFYDTPVEAQADTDGYRSTVFDPKYIPYQELLITPKTHAGLFSFTGRWRRRRDTYTASRWPGTYLTVLVYGDTCILKLRPKPQGKIDDYSFYVSVDGSEDLLYTLPTFDSLDRDREVIFVPITIPGKGKNQKKGKQSTLDPHTIRIISIADHPFSFEGFLVANTLVRQGQLWTDGQDDRVYVEFIGEGVDAEVYGGLLGYDHDNSGGGVGDDGGAHAVRQVVKNGVSVINSTQFRAAEILGIRHAHADAGSCFLSKCDPRDPLPGLKDQYFNENPIPTQVRAEELGKLSKQFQDMLQKELQFFKEDPWLKQVGPQMLVVDVGERDFLRLEEPVDAEKFKRELMVFLGRLRESARPDAHIIVVGRDWENADPDAPKTTFRSVVPQTSEMKARRMKLFQVTKEAATKIHAEDKNLVFAIIEPSNSPKRDLIDLLCTFVIPVFHPAPKSVNPLAKKPQPNKQQSLCISIGNTKHLYPDLSEEAFAEGDDHEHLPLSSTEINVEEHTAPHETAHGTRFIFLYAVVLVGFCAGLAYLLARPFLMVLTNLGIVQGNRRVYGVRDMETGMGFGFGRTGRGRFAKEKNSISVVRRNSGSEEEGFVVLAGGGSQSLGGRRKGGSK